VNGPPTARRTRNWV